MSDLRYNIDVSLTGRPVFLGVEAKVTVASVGTGFPIGERVVTAFTEQRALDRAESVGKFLADRDARSRRRIMYAPPP